MTSDDGMAWPTGGPKVNLAAMPRPPEQVSMTERYECQEEGCNFWSKYKANLKRHVIAVHDQVEVWHVCTEHGCAYRAKRKCHLKGHLASVHGKGLVWHRCQEPGCDYKAKRKSDLASHHGMVHDKDATWYSCPEPGCKCRAKKKASIKRHVAAVHGLGVAQLPCTFPGCSYWARTQDNLLRHEKRHYQSGGEQSGTKSTGTDDFQSASEGNSDASVTEKTAKKTTPVGMGGLKPSQNDFGIYLCRINACNFQCVYTDEMDRHMSAVHLEGNVWFACAERGCRFRSRDASALDNHVSTAHPEQENVRMNTDTEPVVTSDDSTFVKASFSKVGAVTVEQLVVIEPKAVKVVTRHLMDGIKVLSNPGLEKGAGSDSEEVVEID